MFYMILQGLTWNPARCSCSKGSQAMTTPSTPTLRVMCSPWGRGRAPQGVGDSGPEEHPLSESSVAGGVVMPVCRGSIVVQLR